MRRFSGLLVSVILLLANFSVFAQSSPPLGIGRITSLEERRGWTYSVSPKGRELLPGKGTAKQGADIYAKNCVFCHGPGGQNGPYNSLKGTPMFPHVTSIWDYINRAMPRSLANVGQQERQLAPDEVYALTAYLLYLNGLIGENEVLDQNNITKIVMLEQKK